MSNEIAIKSVDRIGNVAYLRGSHNRWWSCTLANGISASLSYAGIHTQDETGVRIELRNARTAEEALAVCVRHGGTGVLFTIVDRGETSATDAAARAIVQSLALLTVRRGLVRGLSRDELEQGYALLQSYVEAARTATKGEE